MTDEKIPKSNANASTKIKSNKSPKGFYGGLGFPTSNGNLFPHAFLLPEIQPPVGFRKLSVSQALMEFGKPALEMVHVSESNEVLGVVSEIWDFTIDEYGATLHRKTMEQILTLISKKLGWDSDKAGDFLSRMVERKHFLFPEENQPKGAPYLFMRKQVSHLIKRFDNERLNIDSEIIPANGLDARLLKDIEKLDQAIEGAEDYEKLGKLFHDVEIGLLKRFSRWLVQKEVVEYADQFCSIVGAYFNFIYGYEHQSPLSLGDQRGKYVVDFMTDFLLRKTSMEPWEYTLAPSALRLLYTFLYEKGYLEEPPNSMIEFIDIIEPHLIERLKEQFS